MYYYCDYKNSKNNETTWHLFQPDTVDRKIFVLKIIRVLKFHGAKFS